MSEAELQEFFDSNKWRFAKSMPWVPHWYLVKANCDEDTFEKAVIYIREHGQDMVWGKQPAKQYLDLGEYRYWTMGAPVCETIILNRELISGSRAKPV